MFSPFRGKYFSPWASGGTSCQEVTSETWQWSILLWGSGRAPWGPVLAWAKWEVSGIFRDSVEKGGAQSGGQLRDRRGSFGRTGRRKAEMLLELKTKPKLLKEEAGFLSSATLVYIWACVQI